MAVVQTSSYSSDWTPSLGTSICRKCGPKKQKIHTYVHTNKRPERKRIPKEPERWGVKQERVFESNQEKWEFHKESEEQMWSQRQSLTLSEGCWGTCGSPGRSHSHAGMAGKQVEWAEARCKQEWREQVPTSPDVCLCKGGQAICGSRMQHRGSYVSLCG